MKFKLEMKCDNAAFDVNLPGFEIARILREVAAKVELHDGGGITSRDIRDINGNTVGQYSLARTRGKS